MMNVHAIRSGYGDIRILNGISFTVKTGEMIGLLGNNGMGKTTLLRTLIGEVKVESGSIFFGDQELTRMPMHKRARQGIGYVPQGRDIFGQLSVMENLQIGEAGRGGKSAIGEVLEYFPTLKPLLERQARALSGGEQQLLALARCLVGKPKLVLLDEPTEGVQPSTVSLMAEKLVELKNGLGVTFILVEQDIEFVRRTADRVLVVNKGRIVDEFLSAELNETNIGEIFLGVQNGKHA
jgi:branched-chain amino acid transport system ATP-binding protein